MGAAGAHEACYFFYGGDSCRCPTYLQSVELHDSYTKDWSATYRSVMWNYKYAFEFTHTFESDLNIGHPDGAGTPVIVDATAFWVR